MISKCSSVILARRKFSEFEDADLSSDSLSIVGYQPIDGELENVQINVKELFDYYFSQREYASSPVLAVLDPECSRFLAGDCEALNIFSCGCVKNIASFDYNLTGGYIQINEITANMWDCTEPSAEVQGEAHLHITFENLPTGKNITLFLKDACKNVPEGKTPKVFLHGIGPDEKIRIYGEEGCPFCLGEEKIYTETLGSAGNDYVVRFVQTLDTDYGTLAKCTRFLCPPFISAPEV